MPPASRPARARLRALVIFGQESDWLVCRFLKPGFRHCGIAVNDGHHWVLFQNVQRLSDIRTIATAGYDLPRAFRILGRPAVEVTLPRAPKGAARMRRASPRGAYARVARVGRRNCVAAIKRILGIEAWWIVTPYQLYRHLAKS